MVLLFDLNPLCYLSRRQSGKTIDAQINLNFDLRHSNVQMSQNGLSPKKQNVKSYFYLDPLIS